jgi:hypothetical protein
LDLGAGHGRDSIFFASNGIEVEALDYSAIAVEILGFPLVGVIGLSLLDFIGS